MKRSTAARSLCFGERCRKLSTTQVANAPDRWIRAEGVIEPIVARPLFDAAQKIIRERARELTLAEKLTPLRHLLRKHGRLTSRIIAESPDARGVSTYLRWFGGLIETYKLIEYSGYRSYRRSERPFRSRHATTAHLSDDALIECLRQLLQKHGFLSRKVIDEAGGVPSAGTYFKRFGSMARAYGLAGFPARYEYRYERNGRQGSHAITFNLSRKQLLDALRRLLAKQGKLTRTIINDSKETPSSTTYFKKFGSMARVYKLIGYSRAAK